MKLRPGNVVEVRCGDDVVDMKVAAINFEGKVILHPIHRRETTEDVMIRLQSQVPPGQQP